MVLATIGLIVTVMVTVWTYQAWMRARWCRSEIKWKRREPQQVKVPPACHSVPRLTLDDLISTPFLDAMEKHQQQTKDLQESYDKGHRKGYDKGRKHYEVTKCTWCQIDLFDLSEHRTNLCYMCQSTRSQMLSNVAVPPRHPGARPNQEKT